MKLEITEEQAKVLLILTGCCSGINGSMGLYPMLYNALDIQDDSSIVDPLVNYQNNAFYSVEITPSMIDKIK